MNPPLWTPPTLGRVHALYALRESRRFRRAAPYRTERVTTMLVLAAGNRYCPTALGAQAYDEMDYRFDLPWENSHVRDGALAGKWDRGWRDTLGPAVMTRLSHNIDIPRVYALHAVVGDDDVLPVLDRLRPALRLELLARQAEALVSLELPSSLFLTGTHPLSVQRSYLARIAEAVEALRAEWAGYSETIAALPATMVSEVVQALLADQSSG